MNISIVIYSSILIILLFLKVFKVNFSKSILLSIYIIFAVNLLLKLVYYPLNESTDYLTYQLFLNDLKQINLSEVWFYNHFEIAFRYICWILVKMFDNNTFFVLVFITNLIIIIALYRTFEDRMNSIIAIYIYMYAPLLFEMSTNIIRQSLVIALILLILTIKSKYKFILVVILPFIHSSSLIFSIYFIFHKYFKTKFMVIITILSALLFLTGTNRIIFTTLGFHSEYTDITTTLYENVKNRTGNRIDFFILTTVSTFIGYYLYRKKKLNTYIFKYVLLSSILFYCIGFQGFSDRLAIYNWWSLLICIPLFINYILEGKRKI